MGVQPYMKRVHYRAFLRLESWASVLTVGWLGPLGPTAPLSGLGLFVTEMHLLRKS
jgi:hypothetical protein